MRPAAGRRSYVTACGNINYQTNVHSVSTYCSVLMHASHLSGLFYVFTYTTIFRRTSLAAEAILARLRNSHDGDRK